MVCGSFTAVVLKKMSEMTIFQVANSVEPVIVDISSSLFSPILPLSVFATVPTSVATDGTDCLFVIPVFHVLGVVTPFRVTALRRVFDLFFANGVFFLFFPSLCVVSLLGTVVVVLVLLL